MNPGFGPLKGNQLDGVCKGHFNSFPAYRTSRFFMFTSSYDALAPWPAFCMGHIKGNQWRASAGHGLPQTDLQLATGL